jgi:hypothetical protein
MRIVDKARPAEDRLPNHRREQPLAAAAAATAAATAATAAATAAARPSHRTEEQRAYLLRVRVPLPRLLTRSFN